MYPINLSIEGDLFGKFTRLNFFRSDIWNSVRSVYLQFFLCIIFITYFGLESTPVKADQGLVEQLISDEVIERADSNGHINIADFDCTQATDIAYSECVGLVEIYEKTGGDGWKNRWLVDTEPCGWPGVMCEEGHVTQLELEGFGLSGNLPDQIGNFTNLAKLELRTNRLDNISTQIGTLDNLYWLGLQNNNLKNVPIEVGNLEKLTTLQLGGNGLSEIPSQIGQLEMLERFDLRNNNLTMLPSEFGQLAHLAGLNLSENQISTLPDEFGNLQALTSLDLSDNPWQEFPIAVTKLSKLGWLYINNSLLTALPDQIEHMTSLKVLEVRNNDLEYIPSTIGKLTNLTGFDFRANLLSTLPTEIQALPNLTWLELQFNRLKDPLELTQISGLDWQADQFIPPSGFRIDNRVKYNTADNIAYSTHLLWNPLPSVIHDGFYEVRYAKSLEDLETNHQSVKTQSRDIDENRLSIDNVQSGETYFFQIFTYISGNQLGEFKRKPRWSASSEIISATVPLIDPLTIQPASNSATSKERRVLIRAKNLPSRAFASLFVNDVIFSEQPTVGEGNNLYLLLDVSDLPQVPAVYLTEIALREPDNENSTNLSIRFNLPSKSLEQGDLDAQVGNPIIIKVHRYVISLMYLPLVIN